MGNISRANIRYIRIPCPKGILLKEYSFFSPFRIQICPDFEFGILRVPKLAASPWMPGNRTSMMPCPLARNVFWWSSKIGAKQKLWVTEKKYIKRHWGRDRFWRAIFWKRSWGEFHLFPYDPWMAYLPMVNVSKWYQSHGSYGVETEKKHFKNNLDILSYCWWLKSCTTWDVWNPINNGINTYQLVQDFSHQQYLLRFGVWSAWLGFFFNTRTSRGLWMSRVYGKWVISSKSRHQTGLVSQKWSFDML